MHNNLFNLDILHFFPANFMSHVFVTSWWNASNVFETVKNMFYWNTNDTLWSDILLRLLRHLLAKLKYLKLLKSNQISNQSIYLSNLHNRSI